MTWEVRGNIGEVRVQNYFSDPLAAKEYARELYRRRPPGSKIFVMAFCIKTNEVCVFSNQLTSFKNLGR